MARGEGGAGWSGVNLGRGREILDALEGIAAPPPYAAGLAWGPEGAKQASDNHETEAWSNEAVRAARWGTEQQLEHAARTLVTAYFPRELGRGGAGVGLWGAEQMAPDNHGHQHLVGPPMARIAARLSGNETLLQLSAELLRVTARALRSVATPRELGFQVWSAGMRAPGVPLASAATSFLDYLITGRLPDALTRKAVRDRNWRDPYYLPLRAIRFLREVLHDDLGGAAEEPIGGVNLKFPMTVYRGDSSHLVVLPRSSGMREGGVCDWVHAPYVSSDPRKTAKLVTTGHDWQTPPPPPPRGSYVLRFPGRA